MTHVRRTVLVVDDFELNRDRIAAIMKSAGWCVSVADGDQNMFKVMERAGSDFDLLILDYRMPGMNGVEIVRHLRSKGVETPAILATSFLTPTIVAEAQAAGVFWWAPVPVPASTFAAEVDRRLGQHRAFNGAR